MSPQEQNSYKYIINIDGHVSAFRLSLELEYGWCILLVESKYKLWFSDYLKPYEHYIPIKTDLSDLIEKIKWCKENDEKCKKIAENAMLFAKKYLSKNAILDYLQKLLFEIKKTNGNYIYNPISIREIQLEDEIKMIKIKYPEIDKNIFNEFPKISRSFNFLTGVKWVIDKLINEDSFDIYIKNIKHYFHSKNSNLKKYFLSGIDIIEKNSENLKHEFFISQKGTNRLLQQIPNFSYTFSIYEKKILMEYIEGITFGEYIKSVDFNIETYLFILLQISLAIQYSQNKYDFIHYDLTPWNIIITKTKEYKIYEYPLGFKNIWKIKTNIIPIIIDYGRSHIIYNLKHYGYFQNFENNNFQDIITILISSLSEILACRIDNKMAKELIILSNFITNTEYRNETFNNLYDLKNFVYKNKNYSEIININNLKIQNKSPIDFINFILENFNYNFNIEKIDFLTKYFDIGNSSHVFEYAFAKNIEEKIDSYLNIPKRIINNKHLYGDNKFKNLYINILIQNEIDINKKMFKNFLKDLNIEFKIEYEDIFNKCLDYIKIENVSDLTVSDLSISDLSIHEFYFKEDDFLETKKIIKLLNTVKKISLNYNKIKDIDIFEDLFFRKDINIDFNFSKYKKISSNIISFKYYCKIIFEKLLQIQNNDDYKKILKLSEY